LNGPVAKVERWGYTTEEKFGNTVEVWDSHSVETYDANQNNIESLHYTQTGNIDKRYVRTFDSNGRLIQVDEYNSLERLESKKLLRYEGNTEIARLYDGFGNLKSADDIELDENGNSIRITTYDVDSGDVAIIGYNTYTSDGNPLSTRVYDDKGEIFAAMDWSYDTEGTGYTTTGMGYLLGSVFMKTESGTRIIETDKHGNWTEEQSYEHKERFGKTEWVLSHIYRRKITYR